MNEDCIKHIVYCNICEKTETVYKSKNQVTYVCYICYSIICGECLGVGICKKCKLKMKEKKKLKIRK